MTAQATGWLGQTLLERYRVTGQLGEGGMGFVYRARDLRLGADVVIKVPRPALIQDPEFAGRFTREVRSLARLAHPHIVAVLDAGAHAGLPFAVLQFLPGGSLRQRRPRRPDGKGYQPVPLAELHGWLPAVAGALDFIHGQRHVHRDVKPDNILFDAAGNAFLGDFGVVKVLADDNERRKQTVLTGTGVVLGTPHYMAPELLLGSRYDGRVDQYALAVTVYELLGGRFPFQGKTPAAIFQQQAVQPPPPLRRLAPGLPAGTVAAVERALAKKSRDRFADCQAFARAVLEPAAREAVRPGPPNAAPRAAPASLTAGCPKCGRQLKPPAEATAGVVSCPSCGARFRPAPATVAAAAVRPPTRALPAASGTAPFDTARHVRTPPPPPVATPTLPFEGLADRPAGPRRPRRRSGAGWLMLAGAAVVLALLAGAALLLWRPGDGPDTAQATPPGATTTNTRPPRGTAPAQPPAAGPTGKQQAEPPAPVNLAPQEPPAAKQQPVPAPATPPEPPAGKQQPDVPKLKNLNPPAPADPPAGKQQPAPAEPPVLVCVFKGHTDKVWAAAVTPDGRHVLSGGGSGRPGDAGTDFSLRLWDAQSGAEEARLEAHTAPVGGVAISPDGRYALSGGPDQLLLWDLQGKRLVRSFPPGREPAVKVSQGPGVFVQATAGAFAQAQATTVINGRVVQANAGPGPVPSPDKVDCLDFSPNGRFAVSGGGFLMLWDVATGRMVQRFQVPRSFVHGVAFSPKGGRLASASEDGGVRIWDVKTGKQVRRLKGHARMAWGVAYSPDGQRLLSCSGFRLQGGKTFVDDVDNSVRLWDAATGKELLCLKDDKSGPVECVAFSPDGKRAAAGGFDAAVRIWDLQAGKLLFTLRGHRLNVTRVAWFPDGRRVLSASRDHTLRVWRLPD